MVAPRDPWSCALTPKPSAGAGLTGQGKAASGSEAALALETNYLLLHISDRQVQGICSLVARSEREGKHVLSHYRIKKKKASKHVQPFLSSQSRCFAELSQNLSQPHFSSPDLRLTPEGLPLPVTATGINMSKLAVFLGCD